MMRGRTILRLVFYALAAVFALFWAFGYAYVNSLACAFGNPNAQHCHFRMPWNLHGEDLQVFVLAPLAILLALLLLGWRVGRSPRPRPKTD